MLLPLLSWLFRRAPFGLLVLALLGLASQVQATHLRAGDIQARIDPVNPRRVFFTMVIYQRTPGSSGPGGTPPDQSEARIFFGSKMDAFDEGPPVRAIRAWRDDSNLFRIQDGKANLRDRVRRVL